MADNTTLNTGVGGDLIRDVNRAGVKTQVVIVDLGGQGGPENLLTGQLPGSVAIATAQVAVAVTATLIITTRTGRIAVTLYNQGTQTVYIGITGVTTGTGLALTAGASITINTQAAIYGISASGTQTVAFLETY